MQIIDTSIPDVKILEPRIHQDERGLFMETFRQDWFQTQIQNCHFVQENHSQSHQGVLRGLHYQNPYPQGKLIRIIRGAVFDVAVDLRQNSPTFKQWVGTILSAQNQRQLWIPEGFAHGFYTLENQTEMLYKCTQYYHPEAEQTLIWNDPSLNIQWPCTTPPILSKKDLTGTILEKALLF